MIKRITFTKNQVHVWGGVELPIHVEFPRTRVCPMGTFWYIPEHRVYKTHSSLTEDPFAARALLHAMLGTVLFKSRYRSDAGDFAMTKPHLYYKDLINVTELALYEYDEVYWDRWVWSLLTDYTISAVFAHNYRRSDMDAVEVYMNEFYNRVKAS